MAFQNHSNFGYSLVASPPSPAISGTTLSVTTGDGVLFPIPPFNVTIFPANTQPLSSNAEIATVTNITGDNFTIVRAQEGTITKSILTGFQIANTITTKVITDIEELVTANQGSITNAQNAISTVQGSLTTVQNSVTTIQGLLPNQVSGTNIFPFGNEDDSSISTISSALITSANIKGATFIPTETSESSLDDFSLASMTFSIQNIIDNTSFDIRAVAPNNATGNFTIKYIINY